MIKDKFITLLLCLETSSKNQCDYFYINKCIKSLFNISNLIKIDTLYLNGKGNYKNVKNKIDKKIKDENKINRETKVIYFIDTDDFVKDYSHKKLNEEITNFCEKMNYDLVWFRLNIENVFYKKDIENSKKQEFAKKFASNSNINFSKIHLSECSDKLYSSNLKLILSKYLEEK